MKPIPFATTNDGKFIEASHALAPFGIPLSHLAIDVPEIKSLDLKETIVEKARAAERILRVDEFIIEDTGIFLSAYPNFPGTYSKFLQKTIGIPGMLALLKGKNRRAEFRTMIAYVRRGKPTLFFEGRCPGRIALRPRGTSPAHFPYDPVFIPDGKTRSFAQMTLKEKTSLSSREKAFAQLGKWLRKKRKRMQPTRNEPAQ